MHEDDCYCDACILWCGCEEMFCDCFFLEMNRLVVMEEIEAAADQEQPFADVMRAFGVEPAASPPPR